MNKHFDLLIERLARLPGIGPRHATRIATALLGKDPQEVRELASSIAELPSSVRLCRECFNVSDDDLCNVCLDKTRDTSLMLVVERISDLQAIERTGLWRGRYHVLGGTIDPVGNGSLGRLHIRELAQRARRAVTDHGSAELTLATSTDTAGEATATLLKQEFSNIANLTVTRLGRGLSTGAHIEYADESTLRYALDRRSE